MTGERGGDDEDMVIGALGTFDFGVGGDGCDKNCGGEEVQSQAR